MMLESGFLWTPFAIDERFFGWSRRRSGLSTCSALDLLSRSLDALLFLLGEIGKALLKAAPERGNASEMTLFANEVGVALGIDVDMVDQRDAVQVAEKGDTEGESEIDRRTFVNGSRAVLKQDDAGGIQGASAEEQIEQGNPEAVDAAFGQAEAASERAFAVDSDHPELDMRTALQMRPKPMHRPAGGHAVERRSEQTVGVGAFGRCPRGVGRQLGLDAFGGRRGRVHLR